MAPFFLFALTFGNLWSNPLILLVLWTALFFMESKFLYKRGFHKNNPKIQAKLLIGSGPILCVV